MGKRGNRDGTVGLGVTILLEESRTSGFGAHGTLAVHPAPTIDTLAP